MSPLEEMLKNGGKPAATSPPPRYLYIGGLVAAGFDDSGEYLLAISHSGRGVFSTATWERVARDLELAYPDADMIGIGIGPIDRQRVPLTEIDYSIGLLRMTSPDGRFNLEYSSGTIEVRGT